MSSPPWLARIRPADLLCGAFLLALLVLALPPPPGAPWLPFEYAALLAGLVALIALDPRGRLLRLFHAFYPVPVVLLVFDSLKSLIPHVNPRDLDPLLIRADLWLFGVHPTVWLERLTTPFLTDLMHLAYVTYYPMPLLLAIRLWRRGDQAAFDQAAFSLVLVFFASYAGYFLVPAIGPSHTLTSFQSLPLEGWLTPWIRSTITYLEGIKRDAFPSGHAAIAVAVVGLAARVDRRELPWLIPAVTGLLLSTVYTRYHYVVDVLAGVPLGVAGAILGPAWARALGRGLGRG
ncbi:MAG: phosphatase PAP2 family protein [Nitrospinota bacterium]